MEWGRKRGDGEGWAGWGKGMDGWEEREVVYERVGRGVAYERVARGVAYERVARGVAYERVARGVAYERVGRGVVYEREGRGGEWCKQCYFLDANVSVSPVARPMTAPQYSEY